MRKVALDELLTRLDRDARPLILDNPVETAWQLKPFDPDLFDEDEDPEIVEMERRDEIRLPARDLLLVEQARD